MIQMKKTEKAMAMMAKQAKAAGFLDGGVLLGLGEGPAVLLPEEEDEEGLEGGSIGLSGLGLGADPVAAASTFTATFWPNAQWPVNPQMK